MLGKKTLENEILREAVERVTAPQKAALARDLVAGGRPVSAIAAALGVSRPHLSSRQRTAPRRRGRPPLPDAALFAAIQTLITVLPTYGYRRVHALLRRQAEQEGRPAPNVKRVYRVMKVHGLLLQRHAGGEERRHEGRIAVDARNTRWCSDGLEIGCDNGERVRVAFALDCCDREAMSLGLSGILCAGPVDHHARMNLSSNMMANWVFASPHSRGDIFHSVAV